MFAGDQPALFAGPAPDAARIGFLSDEVPVAIGGASEQGRVPVRIDGPLRARGWVDADKLRLRVQRRGRVRGAPVYVGPNDALQVLGPAEEGRLRVRAAPRSGARELAAYEGTYPQAGLAAARAPAESEAPPPAVRHALPAASELRLFESPGGPEIARVSVDDELAVAVLNSAGGWHAVRVGDGPYLIGWAQLADARPLAAAEEANANAAQNRAPVAERGMPKRIAVESGALKRVPAGSKVVFGEQVIAVFKAPGWARVLHTYEAGFSDVFAAVDDDVTVRGLVLTSALEEPEAATEPPAAR